MLLDISGWNSSIFTQVWIAFQQEASLVGTSMWQKLTSDEGTHMDVVWTWTCECNHCNVKRKVFKLLHESKIWRKYLIEKGLLKCRGNKKSVESGLWMVTQLGMFMIFHDGYTALSWLQDWWKRSLSLALRSFYPVWANFGRTGRAVAIAPVLDCMSRGYPWIVSACFNVSIYWRMEQQGCKDNNMLEVYCVEDGFWKTVIIFLPPTVWGWGKCKNRETSKLRLLGDHEGGAEKISWQGMLRGQSSRVSCQALSIISIWCGHHLCRRICNSMRF